MSEKYSQYHKQNHWTSGGCVSGLYRKQEPEYQKDHNRSIRVVAVIFLVMAVSALFNLDYAGIVIRAVDLLVSVWGIF